MPSDLILQLELDLLPISAGNLNGIQEIVVQPHGRPGIVVIPHAQVVPKLIIPILHQEHRRCRSPLRNDFKHGLQIPGKPVDMFITSIGHLSHEVESREEIMGYLKIASHAIAYPARLQDIKLGAEVSGNAQPQPWVRVEAEAAD